MGIIYYVDVGISLFLSVCVIILLLIKFRRMVTSYIISAFLLISNILIIFDLKISGYILLALTIIFSLVFVYMNFAEIRKIFDKKVNSQLSKTHKFNKEELYKIIDSTVKSLSRKKTGALITFERDVKLDDVIKSGTIINAPVCQELIETIFYTGTRLHDGAIVIRDDIILAASVYYTPTTRALTGKYGSRHRAAYGISEISDAVTVVVSEETGRVSIAKNGELQSVHIEDFLREFTSVMDD